MNSILSRLINSYEKLPENTNEETIKIHIVLEVLEYLGYKKDNFKFEYSSLNGRCDILIIVNSNDKLIVEIKRKNYLITKDDCLQLCTYLNTHNIEWGILTNGNEYFLMNRDIQGSVEQKICLYSQLCYNQKSNIWNLSKKYNYLLFDYFSTQNLFQKHSTKYFAYYSSYINNYDDNRSLDSRKQYSSAIFRFINYLSKTYICCDDSLLSKSTLTQYMNYYCNNKNYMKDTIVSTCRYLVSFLKYLETNSQLPSKYFMNFNYDEFLSTLEFNNYSKKSSNITTEEAKLLLNYYDNSNRIFASLRNKLILNLLLYIAPSINSIVNIKVNDIDLKRKVLNINDTKISLPPKLLNDLSIYIVERNKLKPKLENLFFTKYGKKYKPLSTTTLITNINNSFNEINSLPQSRKKDLNISNIQHSVIENMLKRNFSLEEISTITGTSIATLSKYLNDDLLKKRIKNINKSINSSKHPYYELFI